MMGKLSRTVLRGGERGDSRTLPDTATQIGQVLSEQVTSQNEESNCL